jgi:hypothetical protein
MVLASKKKEAIKKEPRAELILDVLNSERVKRKGRHNEEDMIQ